MSGSRPGVATGVISFLVGFTLVACGGTDTASGNLGTTRTSPGASSEPVAPPEPVAQPTEVAVSETTSTACVVSAEQVGQAFTAFIPSGDVVIDSEGSLNERCVYTFPPGFLAPSDDGPEVMSGTDGASFTLTKYAYADDHSIESGVYDVTRTFGGSTPQEVYGSSYIATHDVSAATSYGVETLRYPKIGAGLVSDGQSEFILAGTGSYWYEGGIGGMKVNPKYNKALVELASLVAAVG